MEIKYLDEISKAILIRSVEEKLLDLFRNGLIGGTVHTCIGQEFTGIAVSKFLEKYDYVISNHRGHGHYISRTNDIEGLMFEIMGKKDGCSGGIGGSQHLYNKNYLSNGVQGGMSPIATGIGIANKINNDGSISVIYIGDGTLGQGVLYESFNIASLWKTPVLFILENNEMAQSTSFLQNFSGDVELRSKGFGLEYFETNTNDLDHLFSTVEKAVQNTRHNNSATLIQIKTSRLYSHSKGDDNRSNADIQKLADQDVINIFSKKYPEIYNKLKNEANILLDDIIEKANNLENLNINFNTVEEKNNNLVYLENNTFSNLRHNDLIYQALKEQMANNSKTMLLGEDIETHNKFNPGEYGGAFKVTKDLSYLFPDRVKNTPISESAIIGVANGLALKSYRPVVEIMFGDFMTLTLDQILQHSSKFYRMYNRSVTCPIVIRTPMGGYRGYGPTHSQSIEKHFLGIPDFHVVALNHVINPILVYRKIFEQNTFPYLVIENKILYTTVHKKLEISGYKTDLSNEKFPSVRITPENKKPDLTILCYGGMLLEIEKILIELFFEEEILCEIISPTLLYPFDITAVSNSVNKTKKLLIVEEGAGFSSFGSEVTSELLIELKNKFLIKRIYNNSIIPSSSIAEKITLPNKKMIINTVKELFYENC
jgi:2-oxoisovalerate dehydrogenase E1 component